VDEDELDHHQQPGSDQPTQIPVPALEESTEKTSSDESMDRSSSYEAMETEYNTSDYRSDESWEGCDPVVIEEMRQLQRRETAIRKARKCSPCRPVKPAAGPMTPSSSSDYYQPAGGDTTSGDEDAPRYQRCRSTTGGRGCGKWKRASEYMSGCKRCDNCRYAEIKRRHEEKMAAQYPSSGREEWGVTATSANDDNGWIIHKPYKNRQTNQRRGKPFNQRGAGLAGRIARN